MSEGTDGISDATLRRGDWARLIRKPLKAKGHALLDVCSPDGDIQRKVGRCSPRAQREPYFSVPVVGAEKTRTSGVTSLC